MSFTHQNVTSFFLSRAFFRTVAVLVVGVCACAKLLTAGWDFLLLTIYGVYPTICLLHLWFTAVKASKAQPVPHSTRRMLWVSHLLLGAAVLLQYDAGDNSGW